MAGNHPVAGALLASLLLHGSILALPMNPAGLAQHAGPAARWTFMAAVRAEPQADIAQSRPPDDPPLAAVVVPQMMPRPTPAVVAPPAAVPPVPIPGVPAVLLTEAVAGQPSQGTDPIALDAVAAPAPYYHRLSEVTHRPALKAPVLREEEGRLYPVSETLLAVRINAEGTVDNVVVLSANDAAMAQEAQAAFASARYFPGRIGTMPVRVELLIQVHSSPVRMVVTPIVR